MRVLITGVTGFTGSYLAEFIAEAGKEAEVYGLARHPPSGEYDYEFVSCDLTNSKRVKQVINRLKPDYIFHLAGLTVSDDFNSLHRINVVGTLNLLTALKTVKEETCASILIVGSSAEYGYVRKRDLPISETRLLRPVTNYGISKVTEELLGFRFFYSNGMKVVGVRPFNLFGPGQSDEFVCGSLVKQVTMARQGCKTLPVLVGNLEPRRDFIDVRDAVKAYWTLISSERPGEVFNVGSGESHSIREVLGTLFRIEKFKTQVKSQPSRIRNLEISEQMSDISRIRKETNWKPQISFEQSLKDMLDFEKKRPSSR